MGVRTLVGVADSHGAYTAECFQWGAHPVRWIPVLRRIWRESFATDTAAMVEDLLIHRPTDADPLCRGHLNRVADPGMQWLYLIDVSAHAVQVHSTDGDRRWKLYSRHLLATPDNQMFDLADQRIRCTRCGTIDEVEFTVAPSAHGPGQDATIRCLHCGAADTTDATFRSHPHRP
jgi:hypothetical protein